jgi:2-oxoglutarate dehydrogenase E1 component
MEKQLMKALQASSYLSGSNAAYIEELYERYLKNPSSVDKKWQDYFQSLAKTGSAPEPSHAEIREYFENLSLQKSNGAAIVNLDSTAAVVLERKQAQVTQLIDAYRAYGHHNAKLDPLGLLQRVDVPSLDLAYHGLTAADLKTRFNAGALDDLTEASLSEIYEALQKTYCGSLGIEYMHISETEQTRWIQERVELNCAQPRYSAATKRRILEKLIAAEGLEKYLGSKYVGQKRFSLEGGDSLIPLLDRLIEKIASAGSKEIVIGMAHRGRLNVLVNVLGKSPKELFEEFEGKYRNQLGSGDVKYHLGFSSDLQTENGDVHLALAFNPSHLEIVAPVVAGSVRARQERREDTKRNQVIPIQIHGDAAFAGQGVVMETFAMSQARGFSTGGSIHIVVNNQVGFTISHPLDARSTYYCTDIAKMVQAPIFHVNADDPEAVLFAADLALDFRMQFKKDVVIDLVCYRRHGHNEADEPSATQPVMYQKIKQQASTQQLYALRLIQENVCKENDVETWIKNYRDAMDQGRIVVELSSNKNEQTADWSPYLQQEWTAKANTSVPAKRLQQLAETLETLPADFKLQTQVAKMMDDRRKMTRGEIPLNWGYAETLAYASLLEEAYPIRLTGQDSGRGTFAHRHAVLFDQKTGQDYIPLKHLSKKQAAFNITDSLLSEEGVLGFEYGYATTTPSTLVLWEAQFGDFANGAQVVIDQFISSGEQKWGRLCGLVMLLPHGYEGMGPEHSSARLERYLQLCAQHNMQVCVPTTPAQMFHMLRRQMLRPFRKPLIVMTPKSLLRAKLAVSSLNDLTDGQFQSVIPEVDDIKPAHVKRVILCCGKVYYDLLEQRRAEKLDTVAIIRIEQLYPFPEPELRAELERYKKATDVIWCQEEPKNQGAWYQLEHRLVACLAKGQTLHYAGRTASASPAVGYASVHEKQQTLLLKQALFDSEF